MKRTTRFPLTIQLPTVTSGQYTLATLVLVSLVLSLAPGAFAQTGSDKPEQSIGNSCKNEGEALHEINKQCLKDLDLEPSLRGSLLRSWQYQFQLLEQPAFIVATAGGTTSTIPNPNKWLQEHSIVLQPAEWFPTGSNFPDLVKAAYDRFYPDPKQKPSSPIILGRDICGKRTALECLAGKGNFFGRLFSGANVTLSVAQRDEVQQGVLLPNLPISQGWAWGYDITFKPASLFITGANWNSAVSAMSGRNLQTTAKDSRDLETKCFSAAPQSSLANCEKEFARPRLNPSIPQEKWTALAAVIIPTFELKALSQFDFIKQGGVLSQNPLLQRTLKNMTFTWDLQRLIPATNDRIAIGTGYDQLLKPSQDSPTAKLSDDSGASKLCVIYSGQFRSYVGVSSAWTMDSCRNLAANSGPISGYAAACAQDRVVYIGTPAASDHFPGDVNKPKPNCGW
jgi:hypothetical protein